MGFNWNESTIVPPRKYVDGGWATTIYSFNFLEPLETMIHALLCSALLSWHVWLSTPLSTFDKLYNLFKYRRIWHISILWKPSALHALDCIQPKYTGCMSTCLAYPLIKHITFTPLVTPGLTTLVPVSSLFSMIDSCLLVFLSCPNLNAAVTQG